MGKTCEDCIHNEDLLCDAKGVLVKDEDDACRLWTGENERKNENQGGIAKKPEL